MKVFKEIYIEVNFHLEELALFSWYKKDLVLSSELTSDEI